MRLSRLCPIMTGVSLPDESLSPKKQNAFYSFGERAVPSEQPFIVTKRRRQQFRRRRLRLGVSHILFCKIIILSAVNCRSRYAYSGNKEQCEPETHHAVVAGLRRLIIGRLSSINESHLFIPNIFVVAVIGFIFVIKIYAGLSAPIQSRMVIIVANGERIGFV